MVRMRVLASSIAGLAFLFVTNALAETCPERTKLDNAEVKRLITMIKDDSADQFEQILAVETLSCEARKPVRDLAFRAMLRSPNDLIRTDAAFRALADRSSILVKLISEDHLGKDGLEFVKNNPEVIFDVQFIDVEKRCISLYSGRACEPTSAVIVTRNEVVLRYSNTKIVFEVRADGTIEGRYTNGSIKGIPARIEVN